MKLRFLLDTNVLSEPVRPAPNPQVISSLERFGNEIATASPVWTELLYGCYRLPPSSRRREIEHYLLEISASSLPILPYDEAAADWHAAERARLEALGKTPAFVDGQIAAVAQIRGLVLVTRNVSDFVNFEGLAVENWARQL